MDNLYFVYLVCILANPLTRPCFIEHVIFGAFFISFLRFSLGLYPYIVKGLINTNVYKRIFEF